MSSFDLIEENVELSHIHLAVRALKVIPGKCMAENYSLPIKYLKGLCICRIELVFNLFRVRVEGLNVCQRLGMLKALWDHPFKTSSFFRGEGSKIGQICRQIVRTSRRERGRCQKS